MPADPRCPICTPDGPRDWDGLTREHLDDEHPAIVRAVTLANDTPYEVRFPSTRSTRAGDGYEPPWRHLDARAVLGRRA